MQAIRTRYHGPTNTRGSSFSAQCEGGRVVVPYDYALNTDENHLKAARALCAKLGWHDVTEGGVFQNDYYWHAVPRAPREEVAA